VTEGTGGPISRGGGCRVGFVDQGTARRRLQTCAAEGRTERMSNTGKGSFPRAGNYPERPNTGTTILIKGYSTVKEGVLVREAISNKPRNSRKGEGENIRGKRRKDRPEERVGFGNPNHARDETTPCSRRRKEAKEKFCLETVRKRGQRSKAPPHESAAQHPRASINPPERLQTGIWNGGKQNHSKREEGKGAGGEFTTPSAGYRRNR